MTPVMKMKECFCMFMTVVIKCHPVNSNSIKNDIIDWMALDDMNSHYRLPHIHDRSHVVAATVHQHVSEIPLKEAQ